MSNLDLLESNELSKDSNGGTELMLRRLYDGKIARDVIEQFQIIPTRVRDIQEDKYRIYFCHDLEGDPEVQQALGNDGYRRFHKVVCVSNWQAQRIIRHLDVPWSKVVVLLNAIDPLPVVPARTFDKINLIYHSTPHRGLQLLVPVFKKLCETMDNIHLDVYSSFKLYGWEQRDEQFKELYDEMGENPNITNHGSVSQDEIRTALNNAHIFAYPSIWEETSCLCLMEAMSAGLMCVHPNYGALYETAANWTSSYNYNEDANEHASIFYLMLENAIKNISNEAVQGRLGAQKVYADSFYNWENRARQWEALMKSIINSNVEKETPPEEFRYNW